MSLEIIADISHKYGSNAEFVLAGGGNTSYKTEDTLYIKGSGTSLATIQPDEFVAMDRAKLELIWNKTYSADTNTREEEVLADLMDARQKGSEGKRPSVETMLHNLFEQKFVLHVHPAIVNGMTCGKDGKKIALEMFPDAVWVDAAEPGYILAALCRKIMDEAKAKNGKAVDLVILQNHGIFFAGNTEEELDNLVNSVMSAIKSKVKEVPDFSCVETDKTEAAKIAPVLRMLYSETGNAVVKFTANAEILKRGESAEAFEIMKKALTPDHIVYCKAEPLYIESSEPEKIKEAFLELKNRRGFAPKVVFARGIGMFAIGANKKDAETVTAVWTDALKILAYAQNFGGVLYMSDYLTDFIVNWEVENYRSKVALKGTSEKRLNGKIAIVTGSAQGFGQGIAQSLAKEGAYIVVADMNGDGAAATAADISKENGAGTAFAVKVNVSDEESVKNMIEETVLEYGGLDIFVNNAGIVRAGSLEEMQKSAFELVTSVNYTAYFLCAKYSINPMKLQRKIAPDYMMDIVEINSKSGLSGSNKNFAYAGSKFGGIGLTQSFALELAPFGIKVNAVCPGNFLDGPLWSDPEKGLFVQYLNAGKVPGAKTVADVRAFYEAKVPLGRGCRIEDVVRAVLYIIDQKYETGQAIPVTGGQEMLK